MILLFNLIPYSMYLDPSRKHAYSSKAYLQKEINKSIGKFTCRETTKGVAIT